MESGRNRRVPEIWEETKSGVVGDLGWTTKKNEKKIPVLTVHMKSDLLRVARGGSGAKAHLLAARPYPHTSGSIQWARGNCALKRSVITRPGDFFVSCVRPKDILRGGAFWRLGVCCCVDLSKLVADRRRAWLTSRWQMTTV